MAIDTATHETCYAHGQAIGFILSATLKSVSECFGNPHPDEVIQLAEGITETFWDRLDVSGTDYDAVDAGIRATCAAYAAAKCVRAAA